jgi:hypothetical protein
MSNINVYVNHVGQTLLAEEAGVTENTISVKNPAILHVTPNQTGQLQVQLIPYFFREFLDNSVKNDGVTFTFNRSSVVTSNAKLEPKIQDQYERLFAVVPTKPSKDPQVIKLFDE